MRSSISNNASDFSIVMTCERRARNPKVNVIGISARYRDSACCLLQDGVLLDAVQEERFSRVKNDKAFFQDAFRYCLEEAGLTITGIDCIAYYEDSRLKLGRQIMDGNVARCYGEQADIRYRSRFKSATDQSNSDIFTTSFSSRLNFSVTGKE
jgi:predicted NodU family carbamoyl transferase